MRARVHANVTAGWSTAGYKLRDSLAAFMADVAQAPPPNDALFFSDVVAASQDDSAPTALSALGGVTNASHLGISMDKVALCVVCVAAWVSRVCVCARAGLGGGVGRAGGKEGRGVVCVIGVCLLMMIA
jgi:hypothetical protein